MKKTRRISLLVLGAAAVLAGCARERPPLATPNLAGIGSPQSMPQPVNSLPAGAANSSPSTPTQ